ncbi:LOW QUALITY PROTEIN: hypothetical protein PHPALM_29234 [Phytophthora palmivora]|uniref:Uncharacterized protein n=1 Tax=Phytophthora palmivora TaxID=4796 RepID=A0A2P4X860_9STRA|nr:LOW QUALITY PROTEIN: hypothetical protein PHPALM_29234 [Phytophthora palmivora]
MRRASRGLDTPAETIGQEVAAEKVFDEFLSSMGLFVQKKILITKKSSRARASDGLLAKSTALGYFSQVANMLRERYTTSFVDSKRIAKIRDKMASHIEERNLRANVQTNDAPGCTIDDLSVLVKFLVSHADVANGLKSVHDAALLTMMWHTFGRAIDTCFALAASGELFLHVARIKTSVVQGVSIYKSPVRWQQCMLHAFGLLFICYDEPSEHLFPLAPRFAESDLPGRKPYSQEEAIMYWESLIENDNQSSEPPQKRERKRPNVASYINDIIRDTLKAMPPATSMDVTPNLTSHSLRRGAAAYANASPKLAIQWISTRGAWLLESLTKAFAYIGTTSIEDQSVAKVINLTPSIRDLQQRLSVIEFGQLLTLRDELYHHALGFQNARFNVAVDVVDATFASLLMHLEEVLEGLASSGERIGLPRYQYELERGIVATNLRLGCAITKHSLLTSTLENVLTQLVSINDRLGKIEDTQTQLLARITNTETSSSCRAVSAAAVAEGTTPLLATASTLAGSLFNWYTNHIWETVKGKKDQNKRTDVKAAINIMIVLYQKPFIIPQEPRRADTGAYQHWKDSLWTLALSMDTAANERLHSFDHKKTTRKASSLRKRWRLLRTSHPDAYRSLGAQYLALRSSGSITIALLHSTSGHHLTYHNVLNRQPQHTDQDNISLPPAGVEPAAWKQSLPLYRWATGA